MASSTDSPEYARQRRQFALWRELLPGIEEFLVKILSQEKLSTVAEERRQYFVERLDILRLPPSLPPRVGKRLSVELLEESEESCGIPADQVPELSGILLPAEVKKEDGTPGARVSEAEKDFAAEQRKISRNMLVSVSSDKEGEETEESDSAKGVKVYDDIEPTESLKASEHDEDEEDEDDINALYEIPVARLPQPSVSEDNSLSQPADLSSMATAGSIDDISDDVLDASAPPWQPPPLPPRTKKKESESAESRVSTNSLEGTSKPPELPFRPPLLRRNEVLYARSEKSDKSEKSEKSDVSDGDSTSYESFDENENDTELASKLHVKLPKRPKKKTKTSGKLLSSKARSSSTWEINVPFKKLDGILISGEMMHKGKLSWNRRLVAISSGCLALYKPDKETRPVFVIPLSGFSANMGESLGRKGFEMKMSHENGESYTFAVDFKEWVALWCEHINGISQGLSVLPYPQHLARTLSVGNDPTTFGSKTDFTLGEEEEEEEGEYEAYEEYTTDTCSVFSSPPPTPQIPPRFPPRPGLHSAATMGRLSTRAKPALRQNRSFDSLSPSARTASTLTLSRWDWKTLFYNMNFPLDQFILGLRRGNLSNSNLSLSSDGVESDDSSKPRLRANKVMRMGSFAYRATQFFENLGKKSTSKRKTTSLTSPTDMPEINLRDGIQEESSISSVSTGGAAVSPSSEATSPVFEDSFRNSSTFSSPSSLELPPLPPTPPPSIPVNIKHQGYLNIFSSFNKRRWGQRWCLVRENMFECYRTQTSQPCELNFLLKTCVLRQALAETGSPLALMLLESNKEKITVEPPSKEELSQWLRVLMVETGTESVPAGVDDFTATLEAEYSDIVGASVLKSWDFWKWAESPSSPVRTRRPTTRPTNQTTRSQDQKDQENGPDEEGNDPSADKAESPRSDKYLYSKVVKRPSFPTMEHLGDDAKSTAEDTEAAQQDDGKIPRFTDNLAVYNFNKNTTDSGFYSVKETNSDSESGSDVKTDSVSPTQDSPLSASQEEVAVAVCSTPAKDISDSAEIRAKEISDGAETRGKEISNGAETRAKEISETRGKAQTVEEEEEEENALEKTMTSEDFKDDLNSGKSVACEDVKDSSDGGQDVVRSATSAVTVEPAREETNCCENGVQNVNADRDFSVPGGKDMDSASGGAVTADSHVLSEKTDSQLTNGEEVQQRDSKPKKKKKKGKTKKNKQKPPDPEHSPSRTSSVDHHSVNPHPKSQSNSTPDNPAASGIPSSSADPGGEGLQPSARKDIVSEDRQSHGGVCEPTVSTPRPAEDGGKPHCVHISKFSELIGRETETRQEESLRASVKKADRRDLAERSCVRVSEDSGHSTHSKGRVVAGDNASDSVENELLDSWGLSTILTRGLVSDDSDFAEGGDDCLSSPRGEASGDEVHRQLSGGDRPCSSSVKTVSGWGGGAGGVSGLTSALQNVAGEQAKGPEEDTTIVELRERIGRLREKLVQIKRKRIAVRDKRVRAFSVEERTVCDKEYLVLESECKETAAVIQNLEQELKSASSSSATPRS
ncbi:LOW QUALITY PROTEIN: uncharacterized protein LOC143287130 [Babylonia areolata]|uniref:LOW QUALITY PROTEIN: uncharacterized protein LOC143287130 n=1 Tax=Babylonia areolata TaxID=304850 RepID=UPI003FD2A418